MLTRQEKFAILQLSVDVCRSRRPEPMKTSDVEDAYRKFSKLIEEGAEVRETIGGSLRYEPAPKKEE